MAIAFVNSAFSTSSGTAGTSKTISYTPTVGNTLIVFAFGAAVAALTVTDLLGNVYVKFVPATSNTAEVTTFVCRQCKGGATTITVTFASSVKNTCAVVEYSGALEVGLKNTATGSSTAPSIAITTEDANNFVVAGMSTIGTATWAAATGTLRNSQVGASTTTPGGGVMDNTAVSPGAVTITATLGASGAWVVHAVELRSVLQPFLTDQNLDYYNQATVPPWQAGNLKLYGEDEQFSWGYLFDTKMSIDNERFDQPPIQVSYFGLGDDEVIQQLYLGLSEYQHIPDEPIPQQISILFDGVDTESEQFMFNPPLAGTGANLMGYRGFWSLRAGMGSEVDNFSFNPPAPVAISGFDQDELVPYSAVNFIEEQTEDEQFMFNPPLAGTGANLMGFRGFWSLRAAMDAEKEFSYNPIIVAAITPFDFDPQPLPGFPLVQEDELVYPNPPFLTPFQSDDAPEHLSSQYLVRDDVEQQNFVETFVQDDQATPVSIIRLVVDDADDVITDTQFALEDGTTPLRSGAVFGEDDPFGYNPPAPVAISGFDQDDLPNVTANFTENQIEDEQFMFNPPLAGTGANLMGFRGFWSLRAGMEPNENQQVYPNPPFLTPFPDDVQYNPVWMYRVAQEDEQFSYNPVVVSTITPFDDDQQLYTLSMVAEIEDEQYQWGFNPPAVTQVSGFDQDELQSKQLWMYDDTDVFGYLVSQTFAEVHEFGPVQSQSVVSEDEYFGYNTVVVGAITPFDDDQQLPRMLQVTDDDPVWGFKTPVVVNPFEDDQQIPLLGRVVDEDGAWGYNTVVVAAITPFDDDQYAVQAVRVVDDDTNWGYNPAVITAITPFDQDYVLPAVQSMFDRDMEQFGQDQVFVQDDYQNPMVVYPVVQDDDLFGKDVAFAVVLDDNPLVPAPDVDDVDQFGHRFVFAPELDQHPLQPRPLVDDVEMYGSNPTFISEVWEGYGVPLSPPFLYQQDVEIWGYQFPIAYPSSTMEDFQAPQFPLWNLAWDEGWEVQPTIIPFTFKIPIVYKVQNVPLLNMIVRSGLALSVQAVSNQLRLVSEPPETGYGIGGYGAAGYGGGSIGTGVQVSGGPRLLVGSVSTFARLTIQGITVQ